MKKIFVLSLAIVMSLTASTTFAMKSVTIQDQGSFMAGGKIITADGTLNTEKIRKICREILYTATLPMFFIKYLRRQKNIRRYFFTVTGRAEKVGKQLLTDATAFKIFFSKKVTKLLSLTSREEVVRGARQLQEIVPRDEESRRQFFMQMTPDTGSYPSDEIISDSMVEVFKKAGEGILVTHSAGGGPCWTTAIKSDKVKAVIALEPGTFPFPENELPEVEETTSPFPAVGQKVLMENFLKLTKIPVIVYFGDNISTGDGPLENWGFDNWRTRLNLALKWQAVMKKYGGDCEIVYLPDIGVTGNTHFLMSDLNNEEIADLMADWLHKKGLDK